jgi:DUF917 family protein
MVISSSEEHRSMWRIDERSLERIEIGAGILGTGGGGNPYLGRIMARELLRSGAEINVVGVNEVPDHALVTSVGGMGAPVISIERPPQGDEYQGALRALERHTGQPFSFIVPGEIGGSNSTRPLIASAQTGLPVIDGDGMGRAFPELQMCTFMMEGIPANPAALCDYNGHTVVFDGADDPWVLERYARAVTIQMGGAAGYAFPVMSGEYLKRTVVPGTLTLAHALGGAVLEARAAHHDPVAAVLDVMGGSRLFRGKITDVSRRLVGGFARGVVTIEGAGADDGERLIIDIQNENLIARDGQGAIRAVVPDLICIVDQETAAPITTEVLRYGLRVSVLGIPAPAQLRTANAMRFVGPAAFGYHNVPYHPLPGEYGAGVVMAR